MKLVVLAPYGVYPPRSAGHSAVFEPLLRLAELGHRVDLVTPGLRRFERRLPVSFRRDLAPRLREHRLISVVRLLRQYWRGETRLPPVDLAAFLERRMPATLRERMRSADLVQVESPWPFVFVERHFDGPTVLVAHNVECDLHAAALEKRGGTQALAAARAIEGRAFHRASLVLTFGHDDLDRLAALYGPRSGASIAQPIGADVAAIRPADAARRRAARSLFGIPADVTVALFAGSAHAPNRAAADFLIDRGSILAARGVWILIAGTVLPKPANFAGGTATGPLQSLQPCFEAADVALNPMFAGGGMNQKIAQALAWGLPVLSTPFGARGFRAGSDRGLLLAEQDTFVPQLLALAQDPARRRMLAAAARDYAERELSWERIAEQRLREYRKLVPAPTPGQAHVQV